jgi:hypothetical protein
MKSENYFFSKMNKTATASFQLTKQAYSDHALSRARVFEWYTRFRDGRENLENYERMEHLT